MATVEDVKRFWEENPLWTGESRFEPGSIEFFEEHRQVYLNDCFAGEWDDRFDPPLENRDKVLDLGCGPGFWTIELSERGCKQLVAADLTCNALELTSKRCELYKVEADYSEQNAESLSFADASFSHVNCQGVIHHTPSTEKSIAEIARVIKPGGTACISVYHKNIFLKLWPVFKPFAKILYKFGAGLKGRGREGIFAEKDAQEIVRLYDGIDNPIGKAYSKKEFSKMLQPHFEIEQMYLHFFPARSMPFLVPKKLHKFLDAKLGFMIYANLRKI